MKVKHLLVIFVLAMIIGAIGSWFRINYWPFGGSIMSFAFLIKLVCVVLFVVKLLSKKKLKEFLNW